MADAMESFIALQNTSTSKCGCRRKLTLASAEYWYNYLRMKWLSIPRLCSMLKPSLLNAQRTLRLDNQIILS